MKNGKQSAINIFLISVFLLLILFSACDDSVTASDIDNRTIPESNIDYYEHIQPIFTIKCATSFCHDDQSRAGGLSLTNYANTTSDPSIVFPGDPEVSKLIWAIEGTGGVSPMPPAGAAPPLTDDQIRGIRTWIQEGAKVSP